MGSRSTVRLGETTMSHTPTPWENEMQNGFSEGERLPFYPEFYSEDTQWERRKLKDGSIWIRKLINGWIYQYRREAIAKAEGK